MACGTTPNLGTLPDDPAPSCVESGADLGTAAPSPAGRASSSTIDMTAGSLVGTPHTWSAGFQINCISGDANCAAGSRLTNGEAVGNLQVQVDLFCNGQADLLEQADLHAESLATEQANEPYLFTSILPPSAVGDWVIDYHEDIISLRLGITGLVTVLPQPVPLNLVVLHPSWAPAGVFSTVVILGGAPSPPSTTFLCTQSRQISLNRFTAVGGTSGNWVQDNPGTAGAAYYWTVITSPNDYRDGHVESSIQVQCKQIGTGGPTCPPPGNGAGQLNFDADGDHLPDVVETAIGTSNANKDTDGDGLSDYAEVVLGTDPGPNPAAGAVSSADTDNDGLGVNPALTDGVDNCPIHPNSAQTDLDGNGIGDACSQDKDGDGFTDVAEAPNGIYMQEETDGNLTCQPYPNPADPGVTAAYEIVLSTTNIDTDGDGISDGAECFLGSIPGDAAGGVAAKIRCVPLSPCAGSDYNSIVATGRGGGAIATNGKNSRPQLCGDNGVVDDDLDGSTTDNVCGGGVGGTDLDGDGLNDNAELAERNSCTRIQPPMSDTSCTNPAVFTDDLDGDTIAGLSDQDSNMAGTSACNTSGTGNVVVYVNPIGNQVTLTVPAFPANELGCDGPDFMIGKTTFSSKIAGSNGDGDGALGQNRCTGGLGCNQLVGFAALGNGDCSTADEVSHNTVAHPMSDSAPFDFPDVNGDGIINGGDLFIAKKHGGQSALVPVAPPVDGYDRDVDATRDGRINGSDLFVVKKYGGVSCTAAP